MWSIIDFIDQRPGLADFDELSVRLNPRHITVILLIDTATDGASIATVCRKSTLARSFRAISGFRHGQCKLPLPYPIGPGEDQSGGDSSTLQQSFEDYFISFVTDERGKRHSGDV